MRMPVELGHAVEPERRASLERLRVVVDRQHRASQEREAAGLGLRPRGGRPAVAKGAHRHDHERREGDERHREHAAAGAEGRLPEAERP